MFFWILWTSILPNANDVTYKKVGVKQYEKHATIIFKIPK
jgi:hypothetical protein